MTGTRLKYLTSTPDDRAGIRRPPLLAVSIHHGVVPRDELTDDEPQADDLSMYRLCQPGDIVLNRMRAFQGAIGRASQEGIVSPDYLVLRPSPNVDGKFLHYLFRSSAFVGQMVARLRGIGSTDTGSVRTPRINAKDLLDIRISVPTLTEQLAIADYLDRETAQIDALIAAKQRMLSRLAERDLVYVEKAVDTGNWPVVTFRRVVTRMEQGWSPQCEARLPEGEEWGVLKVGCVNGGWFKPDEVKALPVDLKPRHEYVVHNGDLLMSRANTRDLVGSVALAKAVHPRTLLSDKLYRITLDEKRADPRFVCLWLQTRAVRNTLELDATGASDSMQNIGQDTVRRVSLPLPPLHEQGRLVKACEADRRRTRGLADRLRRQIDLLRERRQALVTAAVTGQIEAPVAA